MSIVFDVAWFEARLARHGLDRAGLARAAAIEAEDMALVFAGLRALSGGELRAMADALGADILELSLRAGVAAREASGAHSARIERIEARLDAMDAWLADFEHQARKRA
jgi:hypothetical protein